MPSPTKTFHYTASRPLRSQTRVSADDTLHPADARTRAVTVAEVAAVLDVPLDLVTVLVTDLERAGLIDVAARTDEDAAGEPPPAHNGVTKAQP